jgi:hypothetical protein
MTRSGNSVRRSSLDENMNNRARIGVLPKYGEITVTHADALNYRFVHSFHPCLPRREKRR